MGLSTSTGRNVPIERQVGHIAQCEAPEAADRGVGHKAVAQHALRVIEVEILDDRAAQDDECVGAWRIAAVFDSVDGIGHGFDECHQNRHVFRTAACHHAIDGDCPDCCGTILRQQDAERLVRRAIGEVEECLDLFDGGWNDRQAVTPFPLIEMGVRRFERAAEHDLSGFRLGADFL
jgi:hypothetical protein